ncbi:hypothetical protein RRG08_051946 [Elysia crispata]|uniref:Secreted protein n=1 Tax=Elysia crispata TaxID=231223 RepID=A0AAE1CR52_9GAST|nr:hypothetical protein RRG08_051946 [Elysia crispata]
MLLICVQLFSHVTDAVTAATSSAIVLVFSTGSGSQENSTSPIRERSQKLSATLGNSRDFSLRREITRQSGRVNVQQDGRDRTLTDCWIKESKSNNVAFSPFGDYKKQQSNNKNQIK